MRREVISAPTPCPACGGELQIRLYECDAGDPCESGEVIHLRTFDCAWCHRELYAARQHPDSWRLYARAETIQ